MTWVKICGMTNLEDALVAVEAGADALGFVFYESSPRNVSVETAREIVNKLPEGVEKVGVFVTESVTKMDEVSDRVGLSAVQMYPALSGSGELSDDVLPNRCRRTFVAIPNGSITSGDRFSLFLSQEVLNRVTALVIDSGNSQRPGGTGEPFDWRGATDSVRAVSEVIPIVVAGGLTAKNVSEAISILKPWGVDVASGVEIRPGKKDPEKVRAFVKAVREADRKTS